MLMSSSGATEKRKNSLHSSKATQRQAAPMRALACLRLITEHREHYKSSQVKSSQVKSSQVK